MGLNLKQLSLSALCATVGMTIGIVSGEIKSAQAVTVYNPTPTLTLNAGTAINNFGNLENTANGNGLIGSGDVLTQQHSAGGNPANFWSVGLRNGATPNDVNLDFDFGSQVRLDTLALWNYNAFNSTATDRGIQDFNLIFSNNSDFSSPVFVSGTLTLPEGLGNAPVNSSLYSFSAVEARFARIDVASNYTNNAPNGPIGLSEVRFAEVEPVPEPATILGSLFGGAMMFLKKRSSSKQN